MTIAKSKWTGKHTQVGVVTSWARYAGGGSAADCTAVASSGGRNITSVKYNSATGTYKILFDEVGEVFLGATLFVMAATGAATSFIARPTVYDATAKTLTFDVTDLATPTNHDLATTEQIWITAAWADSDAA